jgi:hypothetical protein
VFGWPDPNTGFDQSEHALYTCYFIIHYLVLNSNWCEFQHELIENLIAKAWRCTARWLHAWRLKEALHSSNHHKTTNKWTNPRSYQFVWPDVPSCPRHHAPVRMQCSCCICSIIIHIANIVEKIHRLSHFLKKCIEYLIISCSGSNGERGECPRTPLIRIVLEDGITRGHNSKFALSPQMSLGSEQCMLILGSLNINCSQSCCYTLL